jgi:hypothetical protein
MMAMRSGELRDEVVNWLRPDVPSDDLPKGLIKALVEKLRIERRSASRVLKHIYVTRRDIILKRISDTSVIRGQVQGKNTNDDKQGTKGISEENTAVAKARATEGVAIKDAKAEVKEGKESAVKEERGEGDQLTAIPCAETNKTELIYSIFMELGIQLDERGAEVSYLLCADFTVHELRVILNKVGSIKSLPSNEQGERLNEVRRLLFSLDEDEIRAYFGLAVKAGAGKAENGLGVQTKSVEDGSDLGAGSVEPEPVNIKEARESLVRELEGLRDVDRYAKAVRGARSELSRIIFEVLRANMPRKDPGTLQLIASTLAGLMLERPGVLMDIVHVETRCRELGITCSGLWGAVKGVVDHVAEAVRHVREHQGVVGGNSSKRSRSDEAAEEVRATAEEMVSEACLGIEEIKDALLNIVYNAISDRDLANTVRELLGKAVITRCGAL